MIKIAGGPLEDKETSNGHNYLYEGYTVIFTSPGHFTEVDNIDVGSSIADVKATVKDIQMNAGYLYDFDRWLIYWIDKNHVTKIVKTRKNGFSR